MSYKALKVIPSPDILAQKIKVVAGRGWFLLKQNKAMQTNFSNDFISIQKTQNSILKNYQFKSFSTANAFLTEVSLLSHLKKHHPVIVNVCIFLFTLMLIHKLTIKKQYNKVAIVLTTDDLNDLTLLDFDMAEKFDKSAEKYLNSK